MPNDLSLLAEFRSKVETAHREGRGRLNEDPDWKPVVDTPQGPAFRTFQGGFTRGESIDREAYTSEAMVSTSDLDRYDSIIVPEGWQLTNFRKSPSVFWGHEDWKLPIAQSIDQRVLSNGLWAKSLFGVKESPDRIGEIWALHANGYIRPWSVSWIPHEWEEFKLETEKVPIRGIRFVKSELLEYSLVGIPGNANALTLARIALASAKRHGRAIPSSELTGDLGILSRACQLAATSEDLAHELIEQTRQNERLIRALEGAHDEARLAPEPTEGAGQALEDAVAALERAGAEILVAR